MGPETEEGWEEALEVANRIFPRVSIVLVRVRLPPAHLRKHDSIVATSSSKAWLKPQKSGFHHIGRLFEGNDIIIYVLAGGQDCPCPRSE